MSNYFLGIDIGTYESKGVLIDEECNIIHECTQKHDLENPNPGYFEHDAEAVWWGDYCKIAHSILDETGIDPNKIAAVGSSTLGADLVAIDRSCVPLRKAIIYGIDSRAGKEIEYLNQTLGKDTIISVHGHPFASGDIAPKILWLKNNEPEVYNSAYKFITGNTYIAAKLTGSYAIDKFLAFGSYSPLYNKDTGSYNSLYGPLFCREDQLAEVHETTDIIGYVTKDASLQTGLAIGTPVITGTDDSAAESVSVGLLEPGDMMVQLGSTMYMIVISDHSVHDSRISGGNHVIPHTHNARAGTNTAGTLTRWFRDHLFSDYYQDELSGGVNAYQQMLDGLNSIPAGSNGLITLPYLAGERTPINDPNAKGIIFGLSLSHTRAHLYKSALEGIGYSLQQHLRIFEENGAIVKTINAVGGGTKNPVWLQILADITGREIHIPEVGIGACFGDAMMAAIGVGQFKNFREIRKFIRQGQVFYPNKTNHSVYCEYQKLFDELYPLTKDIMHSL